MSERSSAILKGVRKQHAAILEGAQRLLHDASDAADAVALAQFASQLYHQHIRPAFAYQDNTLFPHLYGLDPKLDQALLVCRDDHAEIEMLFQRLETEVNQLSILREIPLALEQHIDLEESDVLTTLEGMTEQWAGNDLSLPEEITEE